MVRYNAVMEHRPNTISGLQAKRRELTKLHDNLVSETRKVLCDIDHLDACIRLFDPEADLERIRLNRYATKHRAPKGHQKRFILEQFRTATKPLSSGDITDAWIEERGLSPDESTRVILRKRVGAAINQIRHDGIIEEVDFIEGRKRWRIKEGGQ